MGWELNSWIGMALLNIGKPPQEPTSLWALSLKDV